MDNKQYITHFTKICRSDKFKKMIKKKLDNFNWVYLILRKKLKFRDKDHKIYKSLKPYYKLCVRLKNFFVKEIIDILYKDYFRKEIYSLKINDFINKLKSYIQKNEIYQKLYDEMKLLSQEEKLILQKEYNKKISKNKNYKSVYNTYNLDLYKDNCKRKSKYLLNIFLLNSLQEGDCLYTTDEIKKKQPCINKTITITTLIKSLNSLHMYCVLKIENLKDIKVCDLTNKEDLLFLVKYYIETNKKKLKVLTQNRMKEYPLHMRKVFVNKKSKNIIIGDIHCDLKSLINILNSLFEKKLINNNFKLKKNVNIFFLGDIVDYGYFGLEIFFLILLLYYKNPEQTFFINGNHDDHKYHRHKHFGEELNEKIKNKKILKIFNKFLNMIPCVIFLRYNDDEKYFQLCHGGIDKNEFDLSHFLHKDERLIKSVKNNIYPNEPAYNMTGFKWTDFNYNVKGFVKNKERGDNLYIVGPDYVKQYLKKNKIYSIISGHQDNTVFHALLDKEMRYKRDNDIFVYEPYYEMFQLFDFKCKSQYVVDPCNDFLACVTSTAFNKNVKCSTFLLLEKNNS